MYNLENSHHTKTVGILLARRSQDYTFVVQTESMTVAPFGSNTGNRHHCIVSNLFIGSEGTEDIALLAICAPVISYPV